MYLERQGQRAALRATLLLGGAAVVSNAALADQAPAQPPTDPQKWSPYASIEGSAGSGMVAGKLDLFVPLFQNMDSLVFLNLGVGTETKAHTLFNAGLGYRTEIDSDWIVGAYVNHDSTQLQDNNTFGQTALGAELMSADWDLRLNGYLADNKPAPIPGDYSLYINGTTIAVLQAQDVGYTGFDGEVGYRVWSDDTTDVRVFIGGFHFSHDDTRSVSTGESFDFGYRDLSGPKARAEVTVYDLDVLGNQSRLTLDGEIAHDDVRGTTGFAGATLRIALGNFTGGGGAQALDELDRRMVDQERRNDMVLTRSEFTKPEPVIIYGTGVKSQPTNTLLYVDNTQGVGTYANPTTFADATSRNTTNAFIVLTSKQGPITGGGTLQPGQTVVAGGETFSVQGAYSHATFSHLFDPSTNVTLMPATPGANVITLAPNTTVHGINIVGDFGNAIYGKNVQNVTINNVAIDGTGGGVNGIDIVRTVSGNQNITITNTSVADVSGIGIRLDTHVTDGGTSALTAKFSDVRVSSTGGDGIFVGTYASDGSKITNTVSISNSAVAGAGADGIDVAAETHGAGSSTSETLTFLSDGLTGPKEDGVFVSTYAGGGSEITSDISLSNLTISGAKHEGIYIDTHTAGGGSTIDQTLSVSNATITLSGYYDIALHTYAGGGGSITNNATFANVTLTDANFGGFHSYTGGYGTGSSVHETLDISNVSAAKSGGEGFGFIAVAQNGAQMNETVSLSNASVTSASYVGIDAGALTEGAGSIITETLAFANLSVSKVGTDGVTVNASDAGGTLKQSVSISNATISDIGGHAPAAYGIDIAATAAGGGSYVYQSAGIANASVTKVSGKYVSVGIGISADAVVGGAVVQSSTITATTATHSGTGLRIFAEAFDNGSGVTTVDQHATITDSSFTNDALRGLDVYGLVGSFSGYHSEAAIAQTVSVTGATLDHNGTGLDISEYVIDGASATQNVSLYNVEIAHNQYDGVYIEAAAHALGFAGQSVVFNDKTGAYNTIGFNGGNGVTLKSTAASAGEINQHLYVYSTHVDHNAGDGIFVSNTTGGYFVGQQVYYTHLQQNLIFAYGTASHNGGSGVAITNTVTYAAQIDQLIQVYKETLDHNAGDGFSETSTVTTFQGFGYTVPTNLHSDLYFQSSDASFNAGSGVVIKSTLNSPLYIPKDVAYSYLEQHVTVASSTANHNGANGFVDAAYDQGVFGINIQYVTLQGSQFANNAGDGAHFVTHQFYGPGPFGAAEQIATISGSTFEHNAGRGLYAYAYAGGNQGRAEQHFTVTGSYFEYNGLSGIRLKNTAENGVYVSGFPCTAVQGLTGGCAFVRETFDVTGGSASNNGGAGINVSNYANNFGAIYTVSGRPAGTPTVFLYGVTVNGNGTEGLVSETIVKNHSYDYSYIAAIDTTFDHNRGLGFLVQTSGYANSSIVDRNLLYTLKTGTSTSYNGSYGAFIADYAVTSSTIIGVNTLVGVAANLNGLGGVSLTTNTFDGASQTYQANLVANSRFSNNVGNGLYLGVSGIAASQHSKLYANVFNANGRNAIYGAARNGGYQFVGYQTYGNVLNGGATKFVTTAGGTQVIK